MMSKRNVNRKQLIKAKPIITIGAGAWGTALALVLARNDQRVHLWGNIPAQMHAIEQTRHNPDFLSEIRLPEQIQAFSELSTAMEDIDDVLLVVPSHAIVNVLEQLRDYPNPNRRIILASKGLYQGRFLHDWVHDMLGDIPLAVISGATFAAEVANDLPTAAVLASTDAAWRDCCLARFGARHFRLYTTTDVTGVELCGAVKNILAIATGLSDGLQLGANARCALITRGLAEMQRLGKAVGAHAETFMSVAGIGDLILTCTDDQSRNRRFGLALGQGKSIDAAHNNIGGVVEGEKATVEIYQLAQQHQIDMPIIAQVYVVLQQGLAPQQAAKNLLAREPNQT